MIARLPKAVLIPMLMGAVVLVSGIIILGAPVQTGSQIIFNTPVQTGSQNVFNMPVQTGSHGVFTAIWNAALKAGYVQSDSTTLFKQVELAIEDGAPMGIVVRVVKQAILAGLDPEDQISLLIESLASGEAPPGLVANEVTGKGQAEHHPSSNHAATAVAPRGQPTHRARSGIVADNTASIDYQTHQAKPNLLATAVTKRGQQTHRQVGLVTNDVTDKGQQEHRLGPNHTSTAIANRNQQVHQTAPGLTATNVTSNDKQTSQTGVSNKPDDNKKGNKGHGKKH